MTVGRAVGGSPHRRHNESPSAIPQQKEDVVPPAMDRAATAGQPGLPPRSTNRKMVKKPLSALEIGGDLLVQLVGGQGAAEDLAVDEKGGGGIDVELLRRPRC